MAFSLTVVVLMACALWESRNFDLKSGLFPWLIGIPVLALALVQLLLDGWRKKVVRPAPPAEGTGDAEGQGEAEGEALSSREFNLRTARTLAWICGFIVPVWLLGFKIGAPLCAFVHLKWGEKEGWMISGLLALATWAFIFFLLDGLLHVPFPPGELLALLWPE
jgi:hypothetical protein